MKKTFSMLLALLMILSVPAFAFADAEITVTGTGEVLVPADVAIVSLGVSSAEREVLTAQAKTNEAIAAIRAALIDGGISESDINTGYINIYARYDYSSGNETISGYSAYSTLAIRVSDIDRVGEVIDLAFAAGANTLDGINFSATDTKTAKEDAMKAAVEDARGKAEILAEASGLHLLGIEEITEQNTYSYDKGYMNDFAQGAALEESGTFVQAAKLTVSSSVNVTFKADR